MGMLKKIFGPSKREIWSQIADKIGGEYIEGGFWKSDKLEFKHKEWTIVLDTFTVHTGNTSATYTRIRAPFVNKDGLYFDIYREGVFSGISKFFGMQDIVIGETLFDDSYIIKGNHEEQIRKLLNSDKLRELILHFPRIKFKIEDKDRSFFSSFPEGVDMLYFEHYGVIKDSQSLLNLFLLFSVVLERLVQIDSAYEDDPNITLK